MRPAHSPRVRLSLESLDDRTVPSAGALDPTFGTAGVVSTDLGSTHDIARAVVQQADGKLVAAGETVGGSGTEFAVARYLPGGGLDPAFGTGGVVKTNVTSKGTERALAVALQADGKIVVVGTATVGQSRIAPTVYDNALVVARYNPDGSLDRTFNKSGTLVINPTSGDDEGAAVAVQRDGKILVGGWTNHGAATGNDFLLARLTSTGALDSTFGSRGLVSTDFSAVRPAWYTNAPSDAVSTLFVLADGKILAAGTTVHGFALARYNPDGTLDTAYGTGGRARIGTDVLVANPAGPDGQVGDASAALQADGKVVLAGSLYRPTSDPAPYDLIVARADPAGSPDPAFGAAGLVTLGLGTDPATQVGYDERAGGVGLQADGSVVVGGTRELVNTATGAEVGSDVLLARLTAGGAPDGTFGTGGVVTTGVRGYDSGGALVVQADGRIVQAGATNATIQSGSNSDFLLAGYLPSAPGVGSFTATQAAAGAPAVLTASGLTDGNPGATVVRVTFYYYDDTGARVVATATEATGSAWTVTVGLPPGTYTLYAQATDSYGVSGDPISLSLSVS
jgi:uncharacterized delta-60 repeat protein